MPDLLKTTKPDIRQDGEIKAPAEKAQPQPSPPKPDRWELESQFKKKFGFQPKEGMYDHRHLGGYEGKLQRALDTNSPKGVLGEPTDKDTTVD